jgi:hypothetical protein
MMEKAAELERNRTLPPHDVADRVNAAADHERECEGADDKQRKINQHGLILSNRPTWLIAGLARWFRRRNVASGAPGSGYTVPSHSIRPCRSLLNFAHVSMVYSGDLPAVPGNRNRIPTCFGDRAAVSSIASPIHAGALLEGLGFLYGHWRCSRCHGFWKIERCVHVTRYWLPQP